MDIITIFPQKEESTAYRPLAIRGYHVYRTIWEAKEGEILDLRMEPYNDKDPYAVEVGLDVSVITCRCTFA